MAGAKKEYQKGLGRTGKKNGTGKYRGKADLFNGLIKLCVAQKRERKS